MKILVIHYFVKIKILGSFFINCEDYINWKFYLEFFFSTAYELKLGITHKRTQS